MHLLTRSKLVHDTSTLRVYGLTGGIASGKSLVGSIFSSLGVSVIDADLLARQVVEKGTAGLCQITKAFGKKITNSDSTLNRKKLGAIVFSDKQALKTLNQILHPHIAEAAEQQYQVLFDKGETIAIYEAALLVENQLHTKLDGLIVVSLPREKQIVRLQRRDSINESDAAKRISSQLPLSDKLKLADYIIDNSGTERETREQVEVLWKRII